MNSWPSKVTLSLALLTACSTLNSCRLFGGGKYSSQTEVETDVPESLDHGRPSPQPAAASTANYATSNGVPPTSNLIETTDTMPSPADLSPLPSLSSSPGLAGGASLTSSPTGSIDLPKPDFANVSVHNPRTPAQMLTLESPLKSTPRMSSPVGPASSKPYTSGIVKETVPPAPSVSPLASKTPPAVSDAEIANAPKASKGDSEPGVPLLHSGTRLSDFYAAMHQPLLDNTVVDNNGPPANEPPPVPATDDTAIPPPPAGSGDFAAPKPQ